MEEDDNITGHLISTFYKVSPIPSGGSEVALLLTYSVKSKRIFKSVKSFVNDFMTTTIMESRQKTTRKKVVMMKKSI